MNLISKYKKLILTAALLIGLPVMTAFADTAKYVYDGVDRLVRVEYGSRGVLSYEYDELGNLRKKVSSGTALIINKSGTGDGEVKVSPEGASCGPDCYRYDANQGVTLTAEAGEYSTFDGWDGCTSDNDTCGVAVNGVVTVTAEFNVKPDTPIISVTPESGRFDAFRVGTIASQETITITNNGTAPLDIYDISLSGIDADHFFIDSDNCSNYTLQDGLVECEIEVSFRPYLEGSLDAKLVINSGDIHNPTVEVPLEGVVESSKYNLHIQVDGVGTVVSTNGDIDCGTDCEETYNAGTRVTLNAVEYEGHGFLGWASTAGVECTGVNECFIEIKGDTTITARFAPLNQAIDLIFVIDTSNSMEDDLEGIKTSAIEIMDNVSKEFDNCRIGIVDYRDFPGHPYGAATDYAYGVVLPFTRNSDKSRDTIINAINSLAAGDEGGDREGSVFSALMGAITTDGLGNWRNGAIKSIILMGDSPAHDPEPYTGYTVDSIVEAARDVDPAIIYGVVIGDEDAAAEAYFSRLADETGGDIYVADSSEEVATLIAIILDDIIFSVISDNEPPETTITVGDPKHSDRSGNLYVRGITEFTLASEDDLSVLVTTQYRIDGGDWINSVLFNLPDEGNYLIEYRGIDKVSNIEEPKALPVTVDNTPPVTTLSTSEPRHAEDGVIYITSESLITLAATDQLSGVAEVEYRIDGGDWIAYSPFTIPAEGTYEVEFRSKDNVGNLELAGTKTIIVDNTAPLTGLTIGAPVYESDDKTIYVRKDSTFMLTASDNLSGVALTEQRLDGGDWLPHEPFSIESEGEHLIEYRSTDNVDNREETKDFAVTVDNTPPETGISFTNQVYRSVDTIYISKETEVTLNVTDNLSGLKEAYYLFDDQAAPEKYTGHFYLDSIGYGSHTIRYYSRDNVENVEEEKEITVVVVGIEVDRSILNLPRVLVWTTDPSTLKGSSKKDYTLADIEVFIGTALNDEDIYYNIVTDRDAFKDEFRSGIYNIFVIVDEDNPFGANFTKEMREAVNGGAGLLISGWGNNIRPKLEEVVGFKFNGSLSMNEDENRLQLYESELSGEQTIVSKGRILKTELAGATLLGVVVGNEVCEGIESATLAYDAEISEGDIVRVRLTAKGKGKKVTLLNEEEALVTALPMADIYNNPGSKTGDVNISSITNEGINLKLGVPFGGYLAAEYLLEIAVEHIDGSTDSTGDIAVALSCVTAPEGGMKIGPLTITAVQKEMTTDLVDNQGKVIENLPAAAVNDYGKGKAVMLTFDIVESAISGSSEAYAGILNKAVVHLLPPEEQVEAANIVLVEKKVTLYGAEMDIRTKETLDAHLRYEPLFNLDKERLEYTFTLADKENYRYRYFIRTPDLTGDFFTETKADIMIEGEYQYFDSYEDLISVPQSSSDLLNSAMGWLTSKKAVYPEEVEKITELGQHLEKVDLLPQVSEHDIDKVIHDTIQLIDKLKQLSFDASELRLMLDNYVKNMEHQLYYK